MALTGGADVRLIRLDDSVRQQLLAHSGHLRARITLVRRIPDRRARVGFRIDTDDGPYNVHASGALAELLAECGAPPPDPFATNIAFGGSDMRDAYVTLSSTGQLLRYRSDRPGLATAF